MPDELAELLDTAIYKEIASQAFYIAGQNKTEDPGARALMRELAQEELKHAQWLEALKEKGLGEQDWYQDKVPNLMISEYLSGGDSLEGAGVQDTLLFAMKREQQSVDFYSRMMGMMRDETAKRLCESLVHEELKHKLKLEMLYDDMLAEGEN
ncbi:MAG: ferritin family protein [Dehalococcoidia bacterium]